MTNRRVRAGQEYRYEPVGWDNGQDPTMQTRELREYCARRGWDVAGEYVDVGISGSKDSRPELNRLMADAHQRLFDAVVVWKFDRFARSVSHLLRALETFKALGIEFVSLSEQVDTSTPTGKMVFTALGAVAELERSLIAERVTAGGGMLGRRARSWDGPRLPWMLAGLPRCAARELRGARSLPSYGSALVQRREHSIACPKNTKRLPSPTA